MIMSMTGSGSARIIQDGFDLAVYIRSVNHRFFQLQIKLPRGFHNFEAKIRQLVGESCSRGKIDLFLDVYSLPEKNQRIIINEGLAKKLAVYSASLSEDLGLPTGMSVKNILQFQDVMSSVPDVEHDKQLEELLESVIKQGLESLRIERVSEGYKLVEQLNGCVKSTLHSLELVIQVAGDQKEKIREKVSNNIRQLGVQIPSDDPRLMQEVAFLASKADLEEELIRLKSHLKRFEELLQSENTIGKKADFLIQEMHREINTIGSKSISNQVSSLVVDIKCEIEKMREQIQNIE